tara:strand:- start:305 stop:1741 length:1437 start_codon:yes stop_codon:yes gene_type:complete
MNSYLKQNHLKNNYLAIPDDYTYSTKQQLKNITIKSPVPAITKALNNKQAEIDAITTNIKNINNIIVSMGESIDEAKLARVNVLKKTIANYEETKKNLNNDMTELNKILLKRQELNKDTADNVVYAVVDEVEKQFKESRGKLATLRDRLVTKENAFNLLVKHAEKGDLTPEQTEELKKDMIKANKDIEELRLKFEEEYKKYEKVITKYNYYESSFRATKKGIQLIEYISLNDKVVKADILKPVNQIVDNVNQETRKYLMINNEQLNQLMKLKGMKKQLADLAKEQEETNRLNSQDKAIIKELEGKIKALNDKLSLAVKETVKIELSPSQMLTLQSLNKLKTDENTVKDVVEIIEELEASKIRGTTGIKQALYSLSTEYNKQLKGAELKARITDMLKDKEGMTLLRQFIAENLSRVIGIKQIEPYLYKVGKGRRYKQPKQLTNKQINTIIKKIRKIGGGHESEGSSSSDEDFQIRSAGL